MLRDTFRRKPHIIIVTSMDVPPWEKNGIVIPVVGSTSATTAMFTSIWKKILVVIPNATYDFYLSVAFQAM